MGYGIWVSDDGLGYGSMDLAFNSWGTGISDSKAAHKDVNISNGVKVVVYGTLNREKLRVRFTHMTYKV